ncbi:hypothetical protein DUI87_12621 [Hirundo rustica rustica]|uniref:Uncharacterized protein n=1 Tax=Hirundo rustica rustica TaxID=333673 RepID=A0A3M0KCI6_HIRRU|nr:hypothetical protein DUI87_12621 [Hirundo rustica rustica]
MASHELVDISEGTTAWDLIHRTTSAPSMMPLPGDRRGTRLTVKNQAAHPSGRLLRHDIACPPASASPPKPAKQGKPGLGSWLTRGEMKGDVKLMSGKGELRGCGWARLTGVAADGIAATCWHGAGARPESNIGNISTRQDNYTLELLASEAPSRVEQIP